MTKSAFINALCLAFPDYNIPFFFSARSKNRAIAYANRTLNSTESNYSVTHQETLAVVWALKHFRDILGCFILRIYTDHAAVTELFKGKNLTGQLARWYLTIH